MNSSEEFLGHYEFLKLISPPIQKRTKRKLSDDEVRSRLNRKYKAKKKSITRRRSTSSKSGGGDI